MTVFNRRNALVGYVTLKAASRSLSGVGAGSDSAGTSDSALRHRRDRVGRGPRRRGCGLPEGKEVRAAAPQGYAAAEDAEKIPDGGEAETASADPGAVIAEPIPAT